MPTPRPNETRSQFVSRCIAFVKDNEGITDNSHAAAKCHGIWEQHKKDKRGEANEHSPMDSRA